MMTCHTRLLLSCLWLLPLSSGCARFGDDETVPIVRGPWVGRIEQVTLYDTGKPSHTQEAAILRIIKGPALPHDVPASMGGGSAPIIGRSEASNPRMIPADELPVGKLVEVQRVMGLNHATSPVRERRSYGDYCLQRSPHVQGEMHLEHIILITRRPKVLDE